MRGLLAALVFGHFRENRLRSSVTVIAVALGVAIALAIDLANATAVASFSSSVNVVSNRVNLQVLGVGRGFDERTFRRVEDMPGISYAGPVIEDSLVIGARADDPLSGEILRVLGIDVTRALPNGGGATGGFSDATGREGFDPYDMIDARGAIVSERVARTHGFVRGSIVEALAGDRAVRLRVSGILPKDVAGVDSSVVFVDVATAQEIFEKVGRIDRIDCIVDPALLAQTLRRLKTVLPPGVRAIEPKVRTGEIRRMLQSFQLNLAALSYIALLVGMYLIYNTVAISVVQRVAEIGTARAVGATRRAIFATFLIEGALFGLAGSALGLIAGSSLARFAVAAVSKTVDTLYVGTHADRVLFDPSVLAKSFAIGLMAAVLSSVFPAIEAARTPPATSMRAQGTERRIAGFTLGTALAAALLLALAYLLTFAPAVNDQPLFGYLSGLFIVLGSSLAMPAAIRLLAPVLKLVGQGSIEAALAASNLASSLRRNSVAVASLVVAIAMMISIAILVSSFRTTVVSWANDTLKADIFLRPLGLADASSDARFSPEVVRIVRALPAVDAVDTFRGISIPYHGRITTLGATDFGALSARRKLRLLGGADLALLARTLPGTTGLLVSEPFATRFGVQSGSKVTLDTPSGNVTFTVVAVYNDYSSDAGVAIMDARTFERLYHDKGVNSIAVFAKPGADLALLRTHIVRALLPLKVDAQTTRELRALVVTIFNRTFAITYALYVISITIAVLGVVSTLFALVLERRREIGLLRYLGLSRAGVRRTVYFEAGFIGLLGGIGGVVVGFLLALLLIFVINRQAFGWLIELHVPYAFLAEAVVLVVVAALVAGIYPARIAARMRTADVLRAE